MPRIYYIRHGQTEWNALGRFQGRRDIPLNDRGREEAATAGAILLGLLARDQRPAAELDFVSSPLSRATTTMQLLRRALALEAHGYRIDDRLREISYGDWEGLTFPEMKARDPDHYALRDADRWRVGAPAGEAYVEVASRMSDWLDSVARDTVVVAHGGTMRALMVALGIATPIEAVSASVEQGAVYCFHDRVMSRYT